ncbi:uncharacterized protein [Coffea arabica]|uniref:Reverse transcriptase zinc-binding domain-containing protein n=1 Tax=Coffea arabica TaxID=13443 RepID=A0A6P6W1V0_COFAR|nr:uncharacterized protein LOC113729229 [Coffea arabica]
MPELVSVDQNADLLREVTMEEIKGVVFCLSKDSAPGADGYTGIFFQHCWDTVAPDVLAAVKDFLARTSIPKDIASTLIVLIPKKPNPATFVDFRPISLYTFVNKIFTKVLANRLHAVLPSIIFSEQSAFCPDCDIAENVLLTQEMTFNCIFKLDMMKVFDRASHGIKQGNPLSPILFILPSEALSRGLSAQGGHLILIKPVISAIPLHVLAVMDPPKRVIKCLERLMVNFFWGQSELGPKHHWCSWKNLCYPVNEDGLGVQSFEDIQGAFSCKLWWRFCNSTSLWANYMRSRYSVNNGALPTASRVWRRMLVVRDTVDHFMQVIDLDDRIQRAWILTPSGDFTISSAWDALRPKRACLGSRKCVWSCRIPCKIAIFMWKLLKHYLPFPKALHRFGF